MKSNSKQVLIIALFIAMTPLFSFAQITTKKVSFPTGKSAIEIKGVIVGSQTIDYAVTANAGQKLNATMKANINACYFNVLPPGSEGEAIFIGETEGNSYAGTLTKTGVYKIRVFLMRSSARKGTKVNYTLNISLNK